MDIDCKISIESYIFINWQLTGQTYT